MATNDEKVVHTERIFVTAERARSWLKRNVENNRPINHEKVNQYARDMKAGKWQENGETIKFSEGGDLIDGQHRLEACVQTGIGFWCLIAYGVKKEAFVTIDRGQSRTTGQILRLINGVEDYNAVSASLTWLWRFKDGIMMATRVPTATEANELLEKHPQIRESVKSARVVRGKFNAGPVPVMAICHYLFSRQDATLCEAFFDALGTGAHLREIDPVYQLRQRVISSHANQKKITAYELTALFFKAWQAEKEQRTTSSLKWQINEAFPNIGPIEGELKHRPDMIVKRRQKKIEQIPVPAARKMPMQKLMEAAQKMSLDRQARGRAAGR